MPPNNERPSMDVFSGHGWLADHAWACMEIYKRLRASPRCLELGGSERQG